MLRLALILLFFINGFSTAQALVVLMDSNAYAEAASLFAVRIGIGAAAGAFVGGGNLGQLTGFLLGLIS